MKPISVIPAIITTITMTEAYWTATAYAAVSDIKITKPKEPMTIYQDDGSMYQGHVNENGEKHGQGTFKTAIYISGIVGDENSHLAKWTEFEGQWCNGLLHGQGVMREMSEKAVIRVVHDGMWDTGVPVVEHVIQDRAVMERLIMASLTTSEEFDFIEMCDNQRSLPWSCD